MADELNRPTAKDEIKPGVWAVVKVRISEANGDRIHYRCTHEDGEFFAIDDDAEYVTRTTGVKV